MYCDFTLRRVRVNIGWGAWGLAVYVKKLKSGAFAWLWETHRLLEMRQLWL